MAEAEIFCPLCSWRPTAEDRWCCSPGCGTEWNTFWTRALCPGCGHQWLETQCLRCLKRSPHEAWYHYPDAEDSTLAEEEHECRDLEKA